MNPFQSAPVQQNRSRSCTDSFLNRKQKKLVKSGPTLTRTKSLKPIERTRTNKTLSFSQSKQANFWEKQYQKIKHFSMSYTSEKIAALFIELKSHQGFFHLEASRKLIFSYLTTNSQEVRLLISNWRALHSLSYLGLEIVLKVPHERLPLRLSSLFYPKIHPAKADQLVEQLENGQGFFHINPQKLHFLSYRTESGEKKNHLIKNLKKISEKTFKTCLSLKIIYFLPDEQQRPVLKIFYPRITREKAKQARNRLKNQSGFIWLNENNQKICSYRLKGKKYSKLLEGKESKLSKLINQKHTMITSMPSAPTFIGKLQFSEKQAFRQFQEICNLQQIPHHHLQPHRGDLSYFISSSIFIQGLKVIEKERQLEPSASLLDKAEYQPLESYQKPAHLSDAKKQEYFYATFMPKSHLLTLDKSHLKFHSIIDQIYKQYSGWIIGDISPAEESSKRFLIDNLSIFKQKGLKTIYIDHLLHELQDDLDDYCLGRASMSPILAYFLNKLDNELDLPVVYGAKYGFKALVQSAKDQGIRIVAIDTEDSLNQESTHAALNHQTYLLIVNSTTPQTKFVVLVGAARVCQYRNDFGLSEMLGCPNAVICKSERKTNIIRNIQKIRSLDFEGTVDLFIEYHPHGCS